MTGAYIAVDWGTTNRRSYTMSAQGAVIDTFADQLGVMSLGKADYSAAIASLRARCGDLPILAAGMIGSAKGLYEVPYVAAPATIATLAAGQARLDRLAIAPGVALLQGPRADVMRGEEVQVLGAVASGLAPCEALFCQPGTHNKWVTVTGGRITEFTTAMTGELFALLSGHGTLHGMLDAQVDGASQAFLDGLNRGRGACDLPAALFEIRAAVLLGKLDRESAASFASGLLIGADVGAQALAGRTVHLLASGGLADLYAAAIVEAGAHPIAIDSHAAFAAGAHRIWELTR